MTKKLSNGFSLASQRARALLANSGVKGMKKGIRKPKRLGPIHGYPDRAVVRVSSAKHPNHGQRAVVMGSGYAHASGDLQKATYKLRGAGGKIFKAAHSQLARD